MYKSIQQYVEKINHRQYNHKVGHASHNSEFVQVALILQLLRNIILKVIILILLPTINHKLILDLDERLKVKPSPATGLV